MAKFNEYPSKATPEDSDTLMLSVTQPGIYSGNGNAKGVVK